MPLRSKGLRERFRETLPVWPVGIDGRCTCPLHPNCRRPGKHADPRAPENEAYAVVTGAESGVLVIDPDVKGGVDGLAQLADLEARLGELPKTLEIVTPSDGAHVYVRHPGFRVNGKLASAIDLKGDKATEDGLVYVVGPGSPGYLKTDDPCVVVPGPAYECSTDAPLASLPDAWLAFLLERGTQRKSSFAPEPIELDTPEGQRRLRLGEEAAKTFAPSKADGEGGKRLLSLCLRLVRGLELPLDTARELVLEHFNPRCTNPAGEPFPWAVEDVEHKLLDARDKSDMPCGILSEKTQEGISALKERLGNPFRTPIAPETPPGKEKDKVGADRAYDGERVKVTRAALVQMLYSWPDWKDVFWFDVLAQKPRATNPPTAGKMTLEQGELSKGDFALIAHWLDVHGFLASKELIEDALWTVVRSPDRQRNLIAEYLDSLPPVEGTSILPTLATDVFGATDTMANVWLMKTLVAAARRGRNPGHFHKSMLVLKGDQECGKTPAVKILAGPCYQTTGNGNIADRDTILECQGKLLVEVEELSALNKADADALKTAISRTHDTITKKYEPDGRTYPRSFVLIGTTNKDEFLTDATGNARYWVIDIPKGTKIDLARLEQLRDQIWAEADFLARSGYSNELDGEQKRTLAEKNETYLNTHPWLDDVARYLQGKTEVASASEVLLHILKQDATKADTRSKNAVADLMRTLGCHPVVKWRNGKTVKVWSVPENVPAPAPAKVVALRPAGR